jgi:predicted ester cyclase
MAESVIGLYKRDPLVRLRLAGLPDFSVQIKHQVAEGDKVATLKTFSGTHEGEFMGIPPTGSRVSFDVFDLLRVRDGKVVEHWNVVDMAGLLQQLGAMPHPNA